ncbi:hypothetical protein Trydic_g7779 [Trypoxylus dichotomus]
MMCWCRSVCDKCVAYTTLCSFWDDGLGWKGESIAGIFCQLPMSSRFSYGWGRYPSPSTRLQSPYAELVIMNTELAKLFRRFRFTMRFTVMPLLASALAISLMSIEGGKYFTMTLTGRALYKVYVENCTPGRVKKVLMFIQSSTSRSNQARRRVPFLLSTLEFYERCLLFRAAEMKTWLAWSAILPRSKVLVASEATRLTRARWRNKVRLSASTAAVHASQRTAGVGCTKTDKPTTCETGTAGCKAKAAPMAESKSFPPLPTMVTDGSQRVIYTTVSKAQNNSSDPAKPRKLTEKKTAALGAVLFTIYIRDIPKPQDRRVFNAIYANDTAIVATSRHLKIAAKVTQAHLAKIQGFSTPGPSRSIRGIACGHSGASRAATEDHRCENGGRMDP